MRAKWSEKEREIERKREGDREIYKERERETLPGRDRLQPET